MDRRTFLKGAGLGLGATALGAGTARAGGLVNLALPTLGLTDPEPRTPVRNVVVLMMENRSVDHYLGWYGAENPEFNSVQHATFPDLRADGQPPVDTECWGAAGRGNYHGRGFTDPSHSWKGGRREWRGNTPPDGWLHPDTGNDEFAIGYYDAADVPVWAEIVRQFMSFDRYHCSVLGPTQPNRFYLHSAYSEFTSNSLPPEVAGDRPEYTLGWDWPTIWTLCEQAGLSATYYFSNLPELAFWGPRHLAHVQHISEYYAAAATGTLPAVSFVDPFFIAPPGLSNDDHPHSDLRLGQEFIADVVGAFVGSPCFESGALFLTYDEWGGFWDHVPPARFPDDRATDYVRVPGDDSADDLDWGQGGFRVPTALISPWTTGGTVNHDLLDHASIIKFIAENWGLGYLNSRHQGTGSFDGAFGGFGQKNLDVSISRYDAPLSVRADQYLEEAGLAGDPLVEVADDVERAVLDAVGTDPGDPVAASTGAPIAVSDLHRLAETGFLDGLGLNLDHRFEDSFAHRRPHHTALTR